MNSQCRTLEELTAILEGCQIHTNKDNFIGSWDFHMNENQAFIDGVRPAVSPVDLTSPVGLSPSIDFTEHQSWESFVLNQIAPPTVDIRMASSVEAYLVRLQASHGQHLTVDEAILILRNYLRLAYPSLRNAHFGHFASPLTPVVPPVGVAPMSLDIVGIGPGTNAGTSMEVSAMSDMSSHRRIFVDGDRVKVECLWPECGRILMKDSHPRHVRECHLRSRRGAVRTNNDFHG
ncbi:hypothetical protein DEU56DRAFT_813454 [Suillus clintonianus]|uniref:uncharacterized protein n=1 Tax=Suillus clintonianus TaxID=1904413 RepID=UPI001B885A3B|nr:uncharacterized protein DEU56DRAFT_813454 [Suillus clintonianus]KAG2131814.1 hypothetical protein DEU56DRAFT_813454 [Suillus clintonianus]